MQKTTRQIEVFHYEPECAERKKANRKLRVAAYCRVSTLSEEQELSFSTQRDYYTRLIESQPDKELVGIYGDHGISGLHMEKRTEFRRMIDDCRSGKIDEVITKSVSRFSRNLSDTVAVIHELQGLGIAVVFEREGINSSDPNSELFLNLLASVAQEESNSISQAVMWGLEKKAEAGKPTRRTCFGYRKQPDGSSWVIYEPEAAMVRTAFTMAAHGRRYSEILGRLEEMRLAEDATSISWDRGRLQRMFKNEAYKGDVLTNKHIKRDYLSRKIVKNRGEREQIYIEEHHDAIVSPELWELVSRISRTRVLSDTITKKALRRILDEQGIRFLPEEGM